MSVIAKKINSINYCDVCVVGSGLAGLSAAIGAAEKGASVILLSRGKILSGSSFFPGSWGLGLIAPKNDADCDSLSKKILEVGCHMAEPTLVQVLVQNIIREIERLKNWGIEFRMPENICSDDTLVPCFDDEYRMWRGLLYPSMTKIFGAKIKQHRIQTIANETAIEPIHKDGQIQGIISMDTKGNVRIIQSNATVLATGGMANLFQHKIPTEDLSGLGQYIALSAGARLQNLEFMQFIPGYIRPAYQTIFNERTFRFIKFAKTADNLLESYVNTYNTALPKKNQLSKQVLLESRSGHGPFTSRLPDKLIDFMLYELYKQNGGNGVQIRFVPEIKTGKPGMMIKDYFAWLQKTKGISPDMSIHIAPFFHASNGGIKIDINGASDIQGLFACGECTSGMHGADRIGGLSTANSLVFGRKAGCTAASYAFNMKKESLKITDNLPEFQHPLSIANSEIKRMQDSLKKIMYDNATIIRTKNGLKTAIVTIKEFQAIMQKKHHSPSFSANNTIRDCQLLKRQLIIAEGMLTAMLQRKESRGSHYRADYPQENAYQAKRICVSLKNNLFEIERL